MIIVFYISQSKIGLFVLDQSKKFIVFVHLYSWIWAKASILNPRIFYNFPRMSLFFCLQKIISFHHFFSRCSWLLTNRPRSSFAPSTRGHSHFFVALKLKFIFLFYEDILWINHKRSLSYYYSSFFFFSSYSFKDSSIALFNCSSSSSISWYPIKLSINLWAGTFSSFFSALFFCYSMYSRSGLTKSLMYKP